MHYSVLSLRFVLFPSLAIFEKTMSIYQKLVLHTWLPCFRVPWTAHSPNKDSQDSAQLLYSQLRCIIEKDYNIKLPKGEDTREEAQENSSTIFQMFLPNAVARDLLHSPHNNVITHA